MPGEVRGEVLGVDLPPGPVEGDPVEWHPLDLDDEVGLVALGGERGLDRRVERRRTLTLPIRFLGFPPRHPKSPRRLAGFDAPIAFPLHR